MSQPTQDQIWQNLSHQDTWVRLIYMLIYGVILHIAGALMWILCSVQFIFTLIFGKDNQNVREMCANISQYIGEALAFVSFNSNHKPFPFNSGTQKTQGGSDNEDVIDAEVVHNTTTDESAGTNAEPKRPTDSQDDAPAAGNNKPAE
jgi:cytoskeletal protein RodZ